MKLAHRVLTVLTAATLLVGVGCSSGSSSKGVAGSTASAAAPTTLGAARAQHSAVLMPSGQIFVIGGVDATGTPMTTTALVSATSVTAGPDLATARVGHTAVLLSNGQVVVAGGQSDAQGANVLASSEVYDPTTGTFQPGPTLSEARSGHVAVAVLTAAGERVLLAGGQGAANPPTGARAYLASGELVDVVAGTSSPTAGSLTQGQANAQIARLDSGRFLIVAGENTGAPAAANVFDPLTQSFSPVASVVARSGAAVASRGREVLVAGGQSATGKESSAEVFDSNTQTFAQGVALSGARSNATATISGNEVIVVGGQDNVGASDKVERVDGANLGQATITAAAPLAVARFGHSAHLIAPGKVLVIGGYDAAGVPLASIEEIDLTVAASTTGTTGSMPTSTTSPGITTGTTTGGTTTGGTTTGGTTTTTGGTGGLAGLLSGLLGGGSSTGSTSGGGLSGLLSGLLGGGSSTSGSTGSSSIINVLLQSAVQALTSSSGQGFSGFMSAFVQNVLNNLLGGGSATGGSGLSGLLSGLLGGLTGGSSTGSTSGGSGISGLLSSLLGGLLGGSSGSTGGTSGGLSGALSGLLGGLFGGGGSSSGGSTGGSAGGSTTTPPGLAIAAMNPNRGAVGDTVTLSGTGFGSSVGLAFNGTQATITSATRNSSGVVTLVCTVPAGATTGDVIVASGGNTTNAGTFTVQ